MQYCDDDPAKSPKFMATMRRAKELRLASRIGCMASAIINVIASGYDVFFAVVAGFARTPS